MKTHVDKIQNNKSQSVAKRTSQKQVNSESSFQLVDNRPEAILQRKLQEMVDNSQQVIQLMAYQKMANDFAPIQRVISMKDEGTAKRSTGDGKKLTQEVMGTIASNKQGNILATINQLEQSIKSRQEEQNRFKRKTDPVKYDNHVARIELEQRLLEKLMQARTEHMQNKQPKAKPTTDEDGWTTV